MSENFCVAPHGRLSSHGIILESVEVFAEHFRDFIQVEGPGVGAVLRLGCLKKGVDAGPPSSVVFLPYRARAPQAWPLSFRRLARRPNTQPSIITIPTVIKPGYTYVLSGICGSITR